MKWSRKWEKRALSAPTSRPNTGAGGRPGTSGYVDRTGKSNGRGSRGGGQGVAGGSTESYEEDIFPEYNPDRMMAQQQAMEHEASSDQVESDVAMMHEIAMDNVTKDMVTAVNDIVAEETTVVKQTASGGIATDIAEDTAPGVNGATGPIEGNERWSPCLRGGGSSLLTSAETAPSRTSRRVACALKSRVYPWLRQLERKEERNVCYYEFVDFVREVVDMPLSYLSVYSLCLSSLLSSQGPRGGLPHGPGQSGLAIGVDLILLCSRGKEELHNLHIAIARNAYRGLAILLALFTSAFTASNSFTLHMAIERGPTQGSLAIGVGLVLRRPAEGPSCTPHVHSERYNTREYIHRCHPYPCLLQQ